MALYFWCTLLSAGSGCKPAPAPHRPVPPHALHDGVHHAMVGTAADHDKSVTLGSQTVRDVQAELVSPADPFIRMHNVPSAVLWHRRFGHLLNGHLAMA